MEKSSDDAGTNWTSMNITEELSMLIQKIQALEGSITSFSVGVDA